MTLLSLIHFCEFHGPTLVMTTQILSNRCLQTGQYLQHHEIPQVAPPSCANCAFVIPPVEGAKVPALRSSQQKLLPGLPSYIPDQYSCASRHERTGSSALFDESSSDESTSVGYPPNVKRQSRSSLFNRERPSNISHHPRAATGRARARTTSKLKPSSPSAHPHPAEPVVNKPSSSSGHSHGTPKDSSHQVFEPSSFSARHRLSFSMPDSKSQSDEDDVDLENVHFQPDSPTLSSGRPSTSKPNSQPPVPPKRRPKRQSFAVSDTESEDVAPEHHHEIVYLSTKEPIIPFVNSNLHSVCVDLLSIESKAGSVSITNSSGCAVAHRFDIEDTRSRGGVRTYALVAWSRDPRLIRPLEPTILAHFNVIASQIISQSAASSSGQRTGSNPPPPPPSCGSWLTSNPLASELGSLLTPGRARQLTSDSHIRTSSVPASLLAGGQAPVTSIPPPSARSLVDLVDNDHVFAQLHAALCPLLSLLLD